MLLLFGVQNLGMGNEAPLYIPTRPESADELRPTVESAGSYRSRPEVSDDLRPTIDSLR